MTNPWLIRALLLQGKQPFAVGLHGDAPAPGMLWLKWRGRDGPLRVTGAETWSRSSLSAPTSRKESRLRGGPEPRPARRSSRTKEPTTERERGECIDGPQ
jgi:hypothetical protein